MISHRAGVVVFVLCAIGAVQPASTEEQSSISKRRTIDSSVDFCQSFGDKAAESKLLRHQQELLGLRSNIEEQLTNLELKTRELQDLTTKRDKYRAAVTESLVKIYTNVEPEVAAQQLQKLNIEMVSEVLQRLNPKISGEIVTAMDVKLASLVVKVMLANASATEKKTDAP